MTSHASSLKQSASYSHHTVLKLKKERCPLTFSPPSGIAMPPAGLCFTDVTFFFNFAPLVRTGGRIATRIVASIPSM